jgi:NADH-quinone oxidoreductase subunit H
LGEFLYFVTFSKFKRKNWFFYGKKKGFVLFFLGEYLNIILMSHLTVLLFLGGWNEGILLFILKVLLILFFFIWVRAAFPRYRYDQLMRLGWKVFLPLSLGFVIFTSSIVYLVN